MENKQKRLSNVDIQVLRSPMKLLSSPNKVFLNPNRGKVKNNSFLKKSSISPTKSFKAFSEKLHDLRKKKVKDVKVASRKSTFSKGFMELNKKNKSSDEGISQILQNKETVSSSEKGFYDPYSTLYLLKRNISNDELSFYFKGKRILLLSVLLKIVTAPAYELPDLQDDWVVIGIIAYKSVPKYIQNEKKDMDVKARYCVLTLTDLKWEISLFLFDGAFERYWKIQVGYVIAILNPGIMKPKKIDSGEFSLVLSYEYDSLIELGPSRDLGFCSALKRDGKQCTAWVDIRHSEVCGFHVDQGIRKTGNSRMEIASGTRLYSPKKNKYILAKIGYSRGPKSAERLLAQHTGWIHDPWNGNVFMMPGCSSSYKCDSLNTKRVEKIRYKCRKQEQESNIICKLLDSDHIPKKIISDTLKNGIESSQSVCSAPIEDSVKLNVKPFSAQSIRRIGFNPYDHLEKASQLSTGSTACFLSSNACHNSDSDLEII
ncbi:hypothetical protein PCANB_000732 [Pneumocystis canis]|nr:hypothetical protein PCANB_000732 [Pneumocystis canis]